MDIYIYMTGQNSSNATRTAHYGTQRF